MPSIRIPTHLFRASKRVPRSSASYPSTSISCKRFLNTTIPTSMSLFRTNQRSPFDLLGFNHPVFSAILDPHVDASSDASVQRSDRSPWSQDLAAFGGPRTELAEHKDCFVLTAELPGVPKDQVQLNVDEKARKLSLSGTVKSEYRSDNTSDDSKKAEDDGAAKKKDSKEVATSNKSDGPKMLYTERMYGSFSRSFILPDTCDLSKIAAKFSNDGILRITIPKAEKHKIVPRAVTIEDAE